MPRKCNATCRKVVLSTLMALLLTALVPGLAFSQNSSDSTTSAGIESPVKGMLDSRWVGDLDTLTPKRMLRVLVTYSRTNFFMDGAAPSGVTAMVFQDFELWLNKRLNTGKYPVSIVFIPVRRDELLPALISGRGDIAAASLTVTEARDAVVDFSNPISSTVKEVVVQGNQSPHLKSLDDLSGKRVYVRRSSSYYESLLGLSKRLAAAGRKPVIIEEADEHLESEDILELIGAGVVDYTVVDDYRAKLWAQVIPNLKVREDLVLAADRSVAWAVRSNSPQLSKVLNDFLAEYKALGSVGHLVGKYFGKAGYLRNPTTSQELKRFNKSVKHFRKYAETYSLDYLLIAAQAYQESRLNQAARSSRGAVGVMQIMPSTAAGSPINLPRVHELETNIHAGVKYHRHLINTYFDDANVEPLDRMLFAFAAYNAGPGNMARMRRTADEMGLDNNRWFGNVEIAAGKVTGIETVRYVSNIYKYYVAYKLTAQRELERKSHKARGISGNGRAELKAKK